MPAGWIHYGSVHISRASPRATLTIYHNVKWLNAMTRGQKKVILLALLLIININNILKQVGDVLWQLIIFSPSVLVWLY
jgi:hypothetical protein